MNILKKIKGFVYSFFYGLKGAENEMFVSKHTINSDTNFTQQIQQDNLGENLLKGEVTQEVMDLRHSTYSVSRESESYEYIGDGVAIKKDKEPFDINNFSFIQRNKFFCKGILETIDETNKQDEFTLICTYKDISRFKLERFIEYISIKTVNSNAKITLRFNKSYDYSNPMTKLFYNELIALENKNVRVNSIKDNLESICFTTYKAQGEDDMVTYFFSNLNYGGCDIFDTYINVNFYTNVYSRKDLFNQYYSENQDNKYKNKKSKQSQKSYITKIENYKCSSCGNDMNQIDYEITKYDLGKSLCTKCLEEYLTSQ